MSRSKHRPRDIDWDAVTDLGVVHDGVIARRLGVSPSAVRYRRLTRGIAALPPGRPRKRPTPAQEAALAQTVETALASRGLREVFPWHSAAAAAVILGLCLLALAVRGCA